MVASVPDSRRHSPDKNTDLLSCLALTPAGGTDRATGGPRGSDHGSHLIVAASGYGARGPGGSAKDSKHRLHHGDDGHGHLAPQGNSWSRTRRPRLWLISRALGRRTHCTVDAIRAGRQHRPYWDAGQILEQMSPAEATTLRKALDAAPAPARSSTQPLAAFGQRSSRRGTREASRARAAAQAGPSGAGVPLGSAPPTCG